MKKIVGSAREDRNYMIELYVLYIYIYLPHACIIVYICIILLFLSSYTVGILYLYLNR